MNDLSKEMKMIKIIFRTIAIIVIVIGLGFSYLIAELDDAPGFILIGTTFTLMGSSFIYGVGEIIIVLKKNNAILLDISNKLNNKK